MEQGSRFGGADQRHASHIAVVGEGRSRSGGVSSMQDPGEFMVASAQNGLRDTAAVDGEHGRGDSPSKCFADLCNMVLLTLVTCFVCIFTWAWVDAFRKAKYDQAIGLVTILFFGTIVCTCGYRRRVAAISQMEYGQFQTQLEQLDMMGETRPQRRYGVPPHIRKEYDFFIFEGSVTATPTVDETKEPPPLERPPPTVPWPPPPPAPAAAAHSSRQMVVASSGDIEDRAGGGTSGTYSGDAAGDRTERNITYGPENRSSPVGDVDETSLGPSITGGSDIGTEHALGGRENRRDAVQRFATVEDCDNAETGGIPADVSNISSADSQETDDNESGAIAGVSVSDVLSKASELVGRAAASFERAVGSFASDRSTVEHSSANEDAASVADSPAGPSSPSRVVVIVDATEVEEQADLARAAEAELAGASSSVSYSNIAEQLQRDEEEKVEPPVSPPDSQDNRPQFGPHRDIPQDQRQRQDQPQVARGANTPIFFGPDPEHRPDDALKPQGRRGQQPSTFAWASSTLTDCSVCLEMYRNGDRICRLPCAHAFHAVCIDTWLDQQHVCPQCRHNLLLTDNSEDGEEELYNYDSQRSMELQQLDIGAPADYNQAPFSALFRSPLGSLPQPDPIMNHSMRSTSRNDARGGPRRQGSGLFASAFPPYTPRAGGRNTGGATGAPSPLLPSTLLPLRRSQEFMPGSIGGAGARARGTPASSSTTGATLGTPRFSNPMVPPSSNSSSIGRGSSLPSHPPLPLFSPSLVSGASAGAAETPREGRRSTGRPWSGRFVLPPSGNSLGAHHSMPPALTRGRTYVRGRAPTPRPRRQLHQQSLPSPFNRDQRSPDTASPQQRQLSPQGFYHHQEQQQQQQQRRPPPQAPSRHGPQSGALQGQVPSNPGGVMIAPGVVTSRSGDFVLVGGHGNGNGSRDLNSHQHRRLRLPNLGRRPRSSSCEIITSPGLYVLGGASPATPTPKSRRGGRVSGEQRVGIGTGINSWGTPVRSRSRNGAAQSNNGKSVRTHQVRIGSWDDGDEMIGSGGSNTTTRCRIISDDWGACDWGRTRSARDSAATFPQAEYPVESLHGSSEPSLVTVVDGNAPQPPTAAVPPIPPPAVKPQDSEDNMSTATEEHEYFARTMVYC